MKAKLEKAKVCRIHSLGPNMSCDNGATNELMRRENRLSDLLHDLSALPFMARSISDVGVFGAIANVKKAIYG